MRRFNNFELDDKKDDQAEQADQKHDDHSHDGEHKEGDAHAEDHDHDHGAEDGHAHEGHGDHGHDDHGAADPMDYYMDPGHLFAHVQDAPFFEVPKFISKSGHIEIPNPMGFTKETPMIGTKDSPVKFVGQPTKFMVLELGAAIIIALVFIWLAKKVKGGGSPKGKIWNMLESMVLFVRDDIARPAIGKTEADQYLPFLLTLFFFVLVLNLFGMIPFLGSATAALAVTAVLAIVTFAVVLRAGMKKMGVVGFLKAQVPHMDLPGPLGMVLIGGIWLIEIFGLFVKHFVLAIRLFANMFAGHLVLAVFLAFIGVTWSTALIYGVAPVVVLASIALSVLELFVAFLQAYVFTFLAALFIGSALHPH